MDGTKTYRKWRQQVMRPPHNDFVFAVSASSKTPVSGTGKTTLGGGLAKELDRSDSGFDAETQYTMSAGELGYDFIPEVEDRSGVVLDEGQGTPGEGSGLNARRAMKSETIDTLGSILANRDKMLTVVVIAQNYGFLDPQIYTMTDLWLLIKRPPGHPQGAQASVYTVSTNDFELSSPDVKTHHVEDITWDAMPADDPDYEIMERKKQEAKQRDEQDDADDGLSEVAQIRLAKSLRDETELSWQKIADREEIDRSREWLRQKVDELREEEQKRKQTA